MFEAPSTEQDQIKLQFRTCFNDVESVRLRLWDAATRTESWLNLLPAAQERNDELGPVLFWEQSVNIPSYPTILYYYFEINDGYNTVYYVDDDPEQIPGGWGKTIESRNDLSSFSITVFDARFKVPEWLKGAIIYQVFPDRFRNGDPANDPRDGTGWIYGQKVRFHNWSQPLCDPRSMRCRDEYSNQFYGGDLKGIIEKLAYIKSLGTTAIYLNPIFQSPSNHGYDTTDYFKIDPRFGTLDDFKDLVQKAKSLGVAIILDGVFNHTSSDHPFFDYYDRWNHNADLISPFGPGHDDGSGACESPESPFRSWYFIPAEDAPALTSNHSSEVLCPRLKPDEANEPRSSYSSWAGFATLPRLRTEREEVRRYFFGDETHSVANFWIGKGAMGWRLDLAPEIDPGSIAMPQNRYWQDFRSSLKAQSPESVMIGECWTHIVPFLLGDEWDSSLNYRLRGMLLNWMFDSCKGLGCQDGRSFSDNDNNDQSFSGPIHAIDETTVLNYALSRLQSSPKPSRYSVVSLLGSHDTNRLNYVLKRISGDDQDLANLKQKFLYLVTMTTPGAPLIYYGDEVGASADGVWDGSRIQDDPYNRLAFPWQDLGLNGNLDILHAVQRLGHIHNTQALFKSGDFRITMLDDHTRIIAFERFDDTNAISIVLNRNSFSEQDADIILPASYARSPSVTDLLSGRQFKVQSGSVHLDHIPRLWGMILAPSNTL